MRVFISHSSKDKPAVEALARALRARGIDAWLDKWEIGAGDDFVARINDGLEQADAGIVVFSRHTAESRWVQPEMSALFHACVEQNKLLIPVMLDADADVPPLFRPLVRRGIDEVDAILDRLHGRSAKPALGPAPEPNRRVLVTLRADGAGLRNEVRIGNAVHGTAAFPALPKRLLEAQAAFLQGFRHGPQRDAATADRESSQARMAGLGEALRAVCLPGEAAAAVAALIDGCLTGTLVEICFEADRPALLGLPFEATALPDARVLSLQPPVVMLRRPLGFTMPPAPAPAGPLKILVAVAAPDEGTTSAVLDHERETQNILDAVQREQTHGKEKQDNYQVRILEVGHPNVIGDAIARDAYHVLHLSCHGGPGVLELEDEEGGAVTAVVRAAGAARLPAKDQNGRPVVDLLAPIRAAGNPLPLVLLSACHGGVAAGATASLAEALLRGGIPAVVAMQAPVSDHYAIGLAKAFYARLAERENFLPSEALAKARRELETERLKAVQRGAPAGETQPEFATAALFVAGEERPIADFALNKVPLREPPVYAMDGPVPQLRIGDLIGRRRELREALRSLRDPGRQHAGVVLTGIGGAGKSALAGRVMARLTEGGWLVAAHRGRFDLAAIAVALGAVLLQSDRAPSRRLGEQLVRADLDDRVRLAFLGQVLAEERILLVLDDFEDNLQAGGGAFLDEDAGTYLRFLAERSRSGRLLITSRYPVPRFDAYFRRIPIGPLSAAETRKLVLRLPGLAATDADAVAAVLRLTGGHPRVLEFLDALMRGGAGRFPAVTEKIQKIASNKNYNFNASPRSASDAVQEAVALAAGDVVLEQLLDIARREGCADILLQAAISNLPVPPQGIPRMLAEDPAFAPAPPATIDAALARLELLSLLHRFPGGDVWVHRWTAEALRRLDDPAAHRARAVRAGYYRLWRVQNESHDLGDAVEAIRNFLLGQAFDEAVATADLCFDALRSSPFCQHAVGSALTHDAPPCSLQCCEHLMRAGGRPIRHAAEKICGNCGTGSPCSTRSASTRSASVSAFTMASARLCP